MFTYVAHRTTARETFRCAEGLLLCQLLKLRLAEALRAPRSSGACILSALAVKA